jgi:hypothetical protein
MSNEAEFVQRAPPRDANIQEQIDKLAKATPLTLPTSDTELTKLYVQSIEGARDAGRARKNTDNAIDVLDIAFNATPQVAEEIRIQISGIINKLIATQQDSEMAMRKATAAADDVQQAIGRIFPDWLDVRNCQGPEDAAGVEDPRSFLNTEIATLGKTIASDALSVKSLLEGISATYDGVIKGAVEAVAAARSTIEAGPATPSEDVLLKEVSANLQKAGARIENDIKSANVALFFKASGDFMDQVADETDIKMSNEAIGKEKIGQNYFTALISGIDKFFIRQAAEWNAIRIVSNRLGGSFDSGRSKLNRLRGNYVTGAERQTYLQQALLKLQKIVAESQQETKT